MDLSRIRRWFRGTPIEPDRPAGAPERWMATDYVDERSGLPKRNLGPDEEAALARLRSDGRFCLHMSHGTRAPTYCGLGVDHLGRHLMFGPLYLAEHGEEVLRNEWGSGAF